MKFFHLSAGLLAAMLALPVASQAQEPVKINGSIIDWYYYGKDIHSSAIGWYQQGPGGGASIIWTENEDGTWTPSEPVSTGLYNFGLGKITVGQKSVKEKEPDFLIRDYILYSNCGGFYVGGNEYYSFFGHEVNASENIDGEYGSEEYEILVRKWTWDVDADGNYINVKYANVGKIYNQPTDFAYDQLNDIVYGVFNISDGDGVSGYKLGILDMETFKITYISREAMPINGELRTLAINAAGELFGTDKSGNIYHVSKVDGYLTKLGEMGFTSQSRMMSAAFDFATNTMYWVGYLNNGKNSADTSGTNTTLDIAEGGRDTGLYKITFDNVFGFATAEKVQNFENYFYHEDYGLLGAHRGVQYTGIYVDGSIVKYDKNLRIVVKSAPTQMMPGESGKVTVNVKNIGKTKVRGTKYSVKLYVNNVEAGLIDVNGYNGNEDIYTEDLEAGKSLDLTFDFTAPSKGGILEIAAEVVYAEDELQDNNKTQSQYIYVLTGKTLPTPVLSGEDKGDKVVLTWQQPGGHVLESAEGFMPFTYTGLNDWTMFDGDEAYTQKFSNWNATVDFPNWNVPKAFIVMNPYRAGLSSDVMVGGEKFLAHTGNQYFAGFYGADPVLKAYVDCDDYMVSPRLSGDAQTISFWAKGYRGTEATGYETEMKFNETMEVLYTTQDIDVANIGTLLQDGETFQVAVATFTVNDKAWTQYTAELPAGAKHFALHRNTKADDSFVLLIDDIEFNIAAKTPTAYRIYVNGQLLQEVSADVQGVEIENDDFRNVFNVSAVYEEGESADSNPWSVKIEEASQLVVGPETSEAWKIDAEDSKSIYMIMDNGEATDVTEMFHDHTADFTHPIMVGIEGSDIYIQGLSLDKPSAWIKGQLSGTTATFPAAQFIGHESYMSAQSQYATSGSDPVQPIVFAYDSENNTLTLDASLGIIENDNTSNISGVYAYWDKLVLYKYGSDGLKNIDKASAGSVVTYYNLSGQRVGANAKGVLIQQTRLSDGSIKTAKVIRK
ncbi:MAG: hypothetical protein IJQ59_09895 [Bacteroidaceae bacterium]|nr:hypothetical protein [Bacteroidaceae bacterium]